MAIQKTIYKYFNISSDERKEWLRKVFKENLLYFSSPKSLNDPFEFKFTVSFDASLEAKIKKYSPFLQRTENLNKDKANAKAKEFFISKDSIVMRQWEEQRLKELNEILFSKTCICCFSEKKDDILMWAHYASSHEGVCLRFEPKGPNGIRFIARAFEVNYPEDDNYPNIDFYNDTWETFVEQSVLTKSKHWIYEKERRQVNYHDGQGYKEIPKGIITGILLGCKFDNVNLEYIKELISGYSEDVEVFRMKEHGNKFELLCNKIRL